MFSFLVQLFAVFLQRFQRMSGLDLIKTMKNKKKTKVNIKLAKVIFLTYIITKSYDKILLVFLLI